MSDSDPNNNIFDRNDEFGSDDFDSKKELDVHNAQQRLIQKVLTTPHNEFFSNIDLIDTDMFVVGKIELPYLIINIPDAIHLEINLTNLLHKSLAEKKYELIDILIQNVDMYRLEPDIMRLCARFIEPIESITTSGEIDRIFCKLIKLKIPLHPDNYASIYMLAYVGRIDLLEKIMRVYAFDNIMEIVGKICAVAVQRNHVKILQYFMPVGTFESVPDIIFQYLIKSIEYGDNVDVVQYLTTSCISIAQENYTAVHVARQFGRKKVMEYFIRADDNVINLLDPEEKIMYAFVS